MEMFGLFSKKKNTTPAVVEHLKPQLQKIKAKGQRFQINEVTLAYLSAVHMAASKNASVRTDELRQTVSQLFPDEADQGALGNAFIAITQQMGDDYYSKVFGLLPIAEKEILSGAGDYYVRYNEFALNATDAMFSRGQDVDSATAGFDSNGYLRI